MPSSGRRFLKTQRNRRFFVFMARHYPGVVSFLKLNSRKESHHDCSFHSELRRTESPPCWPIGATPRRLCGIASATRFLSRQWLAENEAGSRFESVASEKAHRAQAIG